MSQVLKEANGSSLYWYDWHVWCKTD